jgi:hypothetical protein
MSTGNGSEIHRLKTMDNYDVNLFNKLYRKLKPLVRKLAKNVDHRRYNVSQDIIQSYFWDKFIYVFNKYQGEYDEQHLQATLINSLNTYKNRLLKKAYNEQSEYYQSLTSLDEVFEADKELIDIDFEKEARDERLEKLYNYMENNLSPDAFLLFDIQLDPPPFIREQLKTDNSKISIMMLLDFFELPRTKTNSNFISSLRREIDYYTKKAGEELK